MQQLATGWAPFETALGTCAVAWGPRGIVAMQLPEVDAPATQARLLKASGPLPQATPPAAVASAMVAVQALLAGQPHDMDAVVLDMQGVTEFQRRVYDLTRRIPPGQTRTYGELATALGNKNSARAVGHALGLNPFAPVVPCHRVLGAAGKPCGFSAHGGVVTKMRMLATEGAVSSDTTALFGFAG
ncbi:methylated-DNA--[protein]-cysteine S-methyltransferase [Simplicispira psychrophila]|uniref:methylated-DNA--[protein]-cysteine S-methyltransferase n=1 Tax=Simplicispira psychrophila TaxID=80882 RepID=UPI000486FFD3|nr:methylated-DNA--[protein]-cysteine S-methyltransferase [Simplicispira psychrophila]